MSALTSHTVVLKPLCTICRAGSSLHSLNVYVNLTKFQRVHVVLCSYKSGNLSLEEDYARLCLGLFRSLEIVPVGF